MNVFYKRNNLMVDIYVNTLWYCSDICFDIWRKFFSGSLSWINYVVYGGVIHSILFYSDRKAPTLILINMRIRWFWQSNQSLNELSLVTIWPNNLVFFLNHYICSCIMSFRYEAANDLESAEKSYVRCLAIDSKNNAATDAATAISRWMYFLSHVCCEASKFWKV